MFSGQTKCVRYYMNFERALQVMKEVIAQEGHTFDAHNKPGVMATGAFLFFTAWGTATMQADVLSGSTWRPYSKHVRQYMEQLLQLLLFHHYQYDCHHQHHQQGHTCDAHGKPGLQGKSAASADAHAREVSQLQYTERGGFASLGHCCSTDIASGASNLADCNYRCSHDTAAMIIVIMIVSITIVVTHVMIMMIRYAVCSCHCSHGTYSH